MILSGSPRSHRARARLHRVVDERKLANARRVVCRSRLSVKTCNGGSVQVLAHERDVQARQSVKVGINRIESLHRDERRATRPNEIADIHIPNACAAIDRGPDRAVIEIYLRRRLTAASAFIAFAIATS